MAESKFKMADGGGSKMSINPNFNCHVPTFIALNITVVNAIITPATKSWFYIIYITDMWFSKPLSNWGQQKQLSMGQIIPLIINHHRSVVFFFYIHRIPAASHLQAVPGPPTRGAGSEAARSAGGCHWPKNLRWRSSKGKIMAVECDGNPSFSHWLRNAQIFFMAIETSMIFKVKQIQWISNVVSCVWNIMGILSFECVNQRWL